MIRYDVVEIEPNHYIKILKCFNDEKDKTEKNSNNDTVICIIPGNPGLVDYYESFAQELNQTTNLPVVAVSHTGHMFYSDGLEGDNWPSASLDTQITHKLKFIEEHLMTDQAKFQNVIFVGHSIGCYCILEILGNIRPELKSRVKKAFLLFPTVERMAVTPSGKVLTFLTSFMLWFIYPLAYLISLLPEKLMAPLVNVFFTQRHNRYVSNDASESLVDNAGGVVQKMIGTYHCTKSVMHMGKDEMREVTELKEHRVKENLDLLLFYYGRKDKWCPMNYHDDMKNLVETLKPNNKDNKEDLAHVHLDEHNMEHAFILFKRQVSTLSKKIDEWINHSKLN